VILPAYGRTRPARADHPNKYGTRQGALNSNLRVMAQTPLPLALQCFDIQSVLQRSDTEIIAALKNVEGIGPKEFAHACQWLREQRRARGDPVASPVEVRARAEEWIDSVRQTITAAVRKRIAQDGAEPEDVARRCATSPAVVRLVQAGGVPSSLELAVRLAVGVGVRLSARVVGGADVAVEVDIDAGADIKEVG